MYHIMGGHVGDTGEFVKGPHPQGNIYNSKSDVIVGVLTRDPVLGEMITCDLEHMIDIDWSKTDPERQQTDAQEASFNEFKILFRLNEWKYVNGLTAVCDGANTPPCKTCSIIHNCWGCPLGTVCTLVPKWSGRRKLPELWAGLSSWTGRPFFSVHRSIHFDGMGRPTRHMDPGLKNL